MSITTLFFDCALIAINLLFGSTSEYVTDHGLSRFETSSKFANLDIPFISNQGQADKDVLFYTRTCIGIVWIMENGEISYLYSKEGGNPDRRHFSLTEGFIDPNISQISGCREGVTNINYFKGSNQSQWVDGLPTYGGIDYGKIYDGITLELKARKNNIEKVFIIEPNANPGIIRARLDGAVDIRVNGEGELEIKTGDKTIKFTRPIAYQEIDGQKKYVDVAYTLDGNTYGFALGEYDCSLPLIIDPLLSSTYLGGNHTEGGDEFWWVHTDQGPDGSIYVAGMTASTDFPIVSGAFEDEIQGNYDLYISKFNSDLTVLEASTYLGGSGFDQIWSLKIDNSGNVYISGNTQSSDFPTTPGVYSETKLGYSDAFISKLSPDLSSLLASTYLGGNGQEFRQSVAIDDDGIIFMVGMTDHSTFPTTTGAYDQTYHGQFDFFVSRLSNDLTTLLASTFLGGTYREDYPTINIDGSGNVVICGSTGSDNYPTTPGAYDEDLNGSPGNDWDNLDVCVSKLSNDLTTLMASTFYGADGYESGLTSCLDEYSNIYVSGHTWNTAFPVTPGLIDEIFSGDEYHITKFDNSLSSLLGSTFLSPGDHSTFNPYDLQSDYNGHLILAGVTLGDIFITGNAYDESFNGDWDAMLAVISDDLTSVFHSTYMGGSGRDGINSFAIDDDNYLILAGFTSSSADFPLTDDAWDDDYNGGNSDAFIARFTFDQFTRVTEGPHVNDADHSSSVGWIDYNNDNYLDIIINTHWPSQAGPPGQYHHLYQNNGDGSFTSVDKLEVAGTGIEGYAASCVDYDNDNDLDILMVNFKADPNYLYINDGSGNFAIDSESGISAENAGSSSPAWIDYDLNGLLDLFIGNSTDNNLYGYDPYQNYLYKDVCCAFSKISTGEIVTDVKHTYSATWCDYDNDGDPDLYTSSNLLEGNDLYRNDGAGNFTRMDGSVLSSDVGHCFCSSWADFDNDGDMDLFVGNTVAEPFLYRNNGNATFTKILGHGLHMDNGLGSQGVWGDYDNDGDQDIFITQYNIDFPELSQGNLFENLDGNTFNKITDGAIASDTHVVISAAWGDYDRDGDLDLYTGRFDPFYNNNPVYSKNRLYRNNGNNNNWITIKPFGAVSNRSAIGAKIRLKANIWGSAVWQMREISSQTGRASQPPLEAHFGLGDAPIVDSIKIEWPGGQITDILTNVEVNQFLTVTETICGDVNNGADINILDIVYLINYKYKSGPEPIPYYSGDVNSDGAINILDIVYLINYVYKNGPAPDCL